MLRPDPNRMMLGCEATDIVFYVLTIASYELLRRVGPEIGKQSPIIRIVKEVAMSTSFVHTIIRRSNRNLLIWGVVGAALLISLAAINLRYLYNFFAGPLAIDRRTLLAADDPAALQRYWVTVTGDDVFDTGFQRVTRNTKTGSERVTGAYMSLLLDKHILLVKAQDNQSLTTFTGSLEALSSDVRSQIIADAEHEAPALRGAFLPYMLNTDSFRTGGYVALGLGIPLFGLCIFAIASALRRGGNPAAHPIMRALGRFGAPAAVAEQLDAELLTQHRQVGELHLTPTWLVQASKSRLAAIRIEDVVWAYKQVTQRRVNGVPTGKSYAAQIWDRHGVCMTVAGSDAIISQALEAACHRAPWLMAGFSPELEKAWKSNRAMLIAAVDQRRHQITVQLPEIAAQA